MAEIESTLVYFLRCPEHPNQLLEKRSEPTKRLFALFCWFLAKMPPVPRPSRLCMLEGLRQTLSRDGRPGVQCNALLTRRPTVSVRTAPWDVRKAPVVSVFTSSKRLLGFLLFGEERDHEYWLLMQLLRAVVVNSFHPVTLSRITSQTPQTIWILSSNKL
jgi:hypothetical protein